MPFINIRKENHPKITNKVTNLHGMSFSQGLKKEFETVVVNEP